MFRCIYHFLHPYISYKKVAPFGAKRIEQRYLATIRDGDIAYLWPSVSLETHRHLHEQGIPIVLEGINTRMASAKNILDAAYDAFGIPPAHTITEARIAEEEEKYQLASAIFAPSRAVEVALQGSAIAHAVLPSSYGVDAARIGPEKNYDTSGRPTVFMFCGYACVRKGAHHLLEAWRQVPEPHRLRIVGRVEPAISERFGDMLNSDRIECVGFVKDVHPWFDSADVFIMPSLEEGDPLVTYEAAAHGLPIIASPMGAGRMGDTPGTIRIVDPADTDAFADALKQLATTTETREELGRSAHQLVSNFTWDAVGERRSAQIESRFGQSSRR